MEVFAIIGFSFSISAITFGLIAFTTAFTNAKKVKELEIRINDLENEK
ncbi:hypothetical protein LC087_14110 [Bacillus carboniphilus]|uniref:Uncharacterized protein n=1 Tax=Bacillus carboniphilus TaxID=86663 RepID=A0ABY9JRH4_9BACI|nr:hypothetical protein [Bacillus carboniphilus]WLR41937.1 hypothetical protein LC087_14110 [Bacillus carboniphilus]